MDYKDSLMAKLIRFPHPEIKWEQIELAGNDSYPYGFEGKPISHFIFQNLTVEDKMGKTVAKVKELLTIYLELQFLHTIA